MAAATSAWASPSGAASFKARTYHFTNPYGLWFAAVDGKGGFYVAKEYMQGIITGQLTEQEAAMLEADTGFQHITKWAGKYGLNCPDAGLTSLVVQGAAVGCSCGCDGAPAGASTAPGEAKKWLERLFEMGKPFDGAMRGVAFEVPSPAGAFPAIVDWTLPRPIKDISGLVSADTNLMPAMSALFPAGDDTAKLRKGALAGPTPQGFIRVRNGSPSLLYDLYVRDELPDAEHAAITAFFKAANAL